MRDRPGWMGSLSTMVRRCIIKHDPHFVPCVHHNTCIFQLCLLDARCILITYNHEKDGNSCEPMLLADTARRPKEGTWTSLATDDRASHRVRVLLVPAPVLLVSHQLSH